MTVIYVVSIAKLQRIDLSDGKEEVFENLFEFPVDLPKEQEEKFIEDAVSSLPWIKAIIVKIELPN